MGPKLLFSKQTTTAILLFLLSLITINSNGHTTQKTMPNEVQNEIQNQLQKSDSISKPILVMLGAEWCTSCRSMKNHVLKEPIVEEFLKGYKFIYIDMDGIDAPMVVAKFREHGYKGGIPYFVIMKQNGNIVNKLNGVRTAEEFCKFLIPPTDSTTLKP